MSLANETNELPEIIFHTNYEFKFQDYKSKIYEPTVYRYRAMLHACYIFFAKL